ncbi:MAG: NUDIX hydrolase [Flavobacteriales bacterium]
MYKIFGNTHLILFTLKSEKEFLLKNGAILFKNTNALVEAIKAKRPKIKDKVLAVVSENPHTLFKTFSTHFKRINAAGGLVYNTSGKLLLIYRRGYWDLPKGKQDPGESISHCAKREVMEECGIKKLKAGAKLTHTYHYYFMHDVWQLKKTTWFKMTCPAQTKLKPQADEGIEKVIWAGKKEIKQSLKNTFPLIHDLLLNHAIY